MTVLPPPTEEVAGLVALLGPETALTLLEQRGGLRLFIADPARGSTIVEMLGLDAAVALHGRYGRGDIRVPLGRAWRVLCYIAMGLTGPQAAKRAGCTEKTVAAILKRYGRPNGAAPERPATPQLDLFRKAG
jgi:hypothetical protein